MLASTALQATRYLTGEEPVVGLGHHDPGRSCALLRSRGVGDVAGKISGRRHQPLQQLLRRGEAGYFRAIAEHGWFGLDPAFNYGGLKGMRSDGSRSIPARPISSRSKWMTSRDASWRRSPAGCPAKKGCAM